MYHQFSHLKFHEFGDQFNIKSQEKAGHWQYALLLFTAMPAAHLHPDVISHSLALDACEAGAAGAEASRVLVAVPGVIRWEAMGRPSRRPSRSEKKRTSEDAQRSGACFGVMMFSDSKVSWESKVVYIQ